MRSNIKQIKELLKEHNYLTDKNIDIDNVRTGKKYSFTCDLGHTFESPVSNVFQSGKFGCPVCSGRRVLKGFNDLWTTHPEIAARLKNSEDGHKYNAGSNVKLEWVCPDCGNEKITSPNKMTINKCLCNVCNKDTSYPEKFIIDVLNQCCVHFEKEKEFDWYKNKRYDFYIPSYDCIVEAHGKQHYTNSDFSYLGGRTQLEEEYNDEVKEFMAKNIGNVSNYIIIDCRKSNMQWIKCNILKSGLLEVLQIIPDVIDWEECDKFATDNLIKLICEAYENEEKNIKKLCEIFNLSRNSIREKLKHGSKLGWCTYDVEQAVYENNKENGKRVINTMSKPVVQMDMCLNNINEFSSIQEAQRTLGISHIWDCIVGQRNNAGGYKWRYKNEH